MLQFITALERVAQLSPYTKQNRFDSFAPIRLNVAAQWLVDGVCASTVRLLGFAYVSPARLLLEPFPGDCNGEREHLHSRLVVISRFEGPLLVIYLL